MTGPDDRPVVVLFAGLTGSGKTTLAKQLATELGIVRLSVDEEVVARHGRYGIDYPEPEYPALEAPVISDVHQRLEALVRDGQSVILDQGLWRRHDRDAVKRLVEAAGGRWRLLYLKAPREVLLARLAHRNARAEHDPNALTVTPQALDDFFARFDEPNGEGEELIDQG